MSSPFNFYTPTMTTFILTKISIIRNPEFLSLAKYLLSSAKGVARNFTFRESKSITAPLTSYGHNVLCPRRIHCNPRLLCHCHQLTAQDESRASPKKNKDGDKKPEEKQNTNKKSDFKLEELNTKTTDGRPYNIKIVSWNVAGLRAMVKKHGVDYLKKEDADVICLQETKCMENECPPEFNVLKAGGLSFAKKPDIQYNMYFSAAEKKGYSGTALLSKQKPLKVTYGLGIERHDKEGRLITAEYEKFYLVTSYVPNSGRGLFNLDYRMGWEEDMKVYLKGLENKKPVIFCGDLNVAHKEIDIANPKSNVKNPGFTKEEREKFSSLLEAGFVDSYRHINPDKAGTYTFWSYMGNAREKNVGWRLDYFVLSKSLVSDLCESSTRPSVMGSDHCPVVLLMAL